MASEDDSNSERLTLDAKQAREALAGLVRQAKDFNAEIKKGGGFTNAGFAKGLNEVQGALKSIRTQMSGFGASLTNINQKIEATNAAAGSSFLRTGTAAGKLATQYRQVEAAINSVAKSRTGFDNVAGIKTSADALKAYQNQVGAVRTAYAQLQSSRKMGDAAAVAGFEKLQLSAADLLNTYNRLSATEKANAAATKKNSAEKLEALRKEKQAYNELNQSARGAYYANRSAQRYEERQRRLSMANNIPVGDDGGREPMGAKIARQASTFANYALLGSALGGAASTLNEVVKLDTALHNLQGITQTTDAGMVKLRQSILTVASGSRFMASEIADAATILGQAGLSADQISVSLKGVTEFAQAAGIKLQESVNLLTSATGAFNLRADQTSEVANVFTAALNKSKLTVEQLSQGFQYAASSAAQSGISFRELTVMMELLAQAGIKSGSTIGTGIRQVITQLSAPNEKFKQVLVGLKLSMDDVSLRQHSMITIIDTLKKAGFDAGDAFQSFGTRGAAAFIALQAQVSKAPQFTADLNDSAAAANAAAKQMESLSASSKRFYSSIAALISTGAEPLVRSLQMLFTAASSLITPLQRLGPVIQIVATGLALFAGAKALGYIAGITGIANAFRFLIVQGVGVSAMTVAMGALSMIFNPMTLLVGGLSIALTAATYAWNAHKVAVAANNEALDSAKTKYETQKQLSIQLATETQDLLNKQNDLKNGSPALGAKIQELGGKFKELGLDVTQLNNNYDQLLDRMRTLRGVALLQETNALIDARAKGQNVLQDRRNDTDSAVRGLQLGRGVFGVRGLLRQYDSSGLNLPEVTKVRNKLNTFGARPKEEDISLLYRAAQSADSQGTNVSPENKKLLKDLYEAISRLAKATQAEFELEKTLANQGKIIEASKLRGSGVLPGFQTNTEDLIARIKQGKNAYSNDQLTDPVKYAGDINAWAKDGIAQLQTQMNATKSWAGKDEIRKAAVKDIQDRISQAIADLNVDIETSNNAAKSQRRIVAGYMERRIDRLIAEAQSELATAGTEGAIKKTYNKLRGLTAQKYEAQADDKAAEMGLKRGDYTVVGGKLSVNHGGLTSTNKLKLEEFNDIVGADQRKLKNDELAMLGRLNAKLGKSTDRGDGMVSSAEISAVRADVNNYLRDVSLQFRSLDKYAPTSVVKRHSEAALESLQKWYVASMEIIEEELAKQIKALPVNTTAGDEQGAALRAAAEAKKVELLESLGMRREEVTNRTQDILNDPRSRLPANMQEAYQNIGQAFEDPRKTKYQTSEYATLFQDSMISAVDAVKSSFSSLWVSIFDGSKSASQAFADFGKSILGAMAEVVASHIAKQFLQMALSFLPGMGGGGGNGFVDSASANGMEGGFYKQGGLVRRAMGGSISMVRGPITTRDSVPTMMQPGSFIMRQSVSSKMLRRASGGMVPTLLQPGELAFSPNAVSTIGEGHLRRMNAGGVVDGGVGMGPISDRLQGAAAKAMKGKEPSHTNVWVVKPDQMPSMTKGDVLVTITEDILANGQTKKMIKSVMNGG